MKCKDCGSEMTTQNEPYPLIDWMVPFTNLNIILWHWRDIPVCMECIIEAEQDRERQIWEAGYALCAEKNNYGE